MKLRKSPRKAALLAQLPGKIFFPLHLKPNHRKRFNFSLNRCKPAEGYPAFYKTYMDRVPGDGLLIQHLQDIQTETEKLIGGLVEEKLLYSYDTGKWTIKDILVHLSDCERVIIYRAMRIARGDKTELPGFDENLFAQNAHANTRKVDDLLKELSVVRIATLVFMETLDETSLDRTGTANALSLSARLLVNHIYGHHRHHLAIIREKYLT